MPISPSRNFPLYVRVFKARLYDNVGIGGPIFNCWDETGYYPERLDQPRELQVLWAANCCQLDVVSGGFYQFFNDGGIGMVAPEAVEGFRLIGLENAADLLEKAMALFGQPYPRSHDRRIELSPPQPTESNPSPFSDLDEKFAGEMGSNHSCDRFDEAADKFVERYL